MLTSLLFDRILSQPDTAKVVFLDKRCLRSRFNRSECRACLDECQTGALKLYGRMVTCNQDKCTGCMRCLSVCPNDAFDGGLDLRQLLETLHSSSQIVLTCKKNAPFQQKFIIPCIGALSEPVLTAINSVAMDSFCVDLSHCPDCINTHCLRLFHRKIERLTDRLRTNGHTALKYSIKENSAHSVTENVARRSYLGMAKNSLMDLGRESIITGKTETSSSHNRAGKEPSMNSVALQYAYRNSAEADRHVLLSSFFTVSATKECNLCPGCQGMCPTGALKRTEVKGKKRLMFTSSACSGCALCQEFCRKVAITIIRGFSGNPEEPLYIR